MSNEIIDMCCPECIDKIILNNLIDKGRIIKHTLEPQQNLDTLLVQELQKENEILRRQNEKMNMVLCKIMGEMNELTKEYNKGL